MLTHYQINAKLLSYFVNNITMIFNIKLLCRDTQIHKTCPYYKHNFHCTYNVQASSNIYTY